MPFIFISSKYGGENEVLKEENVNIGYSRVLFGMLYENIILQMSKEKFFSW